jgi:DNA-binding NtrC family response regulator
VLAKLKQEIPALPVVMLTGHQDIKSAVRATQLGAFDYLTKPFHNEEIVVVVRRALQARALQLEVEDLRRQLGAGGGLVSQMGPSPQVRGLVEQVRAVAGTSFTVLVMGETGSGKELVAQAIHRESERNAKPFVAVDCGAIPEQLLESELFGHEKGAFTHAQSAKPGLLELADAGSFFLDEVGETDPTVQAKVLKFLDSGRYRRVGGLEEREVDVRVLAATQKDLEEEVRAGRFRADLYHRLHVVSVRIPPLRERAGDARLLLEHFLREFARRQGRPQLRWSPEAMQRLERHTWPGNVREIVNLCERVVLLARGDSEIGPQDLPEPLGDNRVVRATRDTAKKLLLEVPEGITFDEIERGVLEQALDRSQRNVSAAAASLGMGRGQFRYRMERLGMIESPQQPVTRRVTKKPARPPSKDR